MASRCGRFSDPDTCIPNYEDLSSTGFPASTFCSRLGADVGSLFFGQRSADDKGDVKAERPKAFATDKIFLLHSVFYRRRALPYPLIVCPLLPSKRNRHIPSFERKKNVSTMKTERSYHPQNRFETKRRLLTLPQKNRLDRRLCCGVESHRHFRRIDRHLDAVCRLLSRACNTPNGSSGAVLFDPMDLHCRCIGLDR